MATKKKDAKFHSNILNVRIRALMESKQTKTEAFARALSVTPEAVRLWHSGYARPDIDKICLIAGFFEVTTDYLLGLSETPHAEHVNAVELTGLSPKAIEILENANKRKEKEFDFDNKLYVLNHIIDTMNTSNFLIDFYMYLFEGFGFPIPDDEEHYHTVTDIVHGRKSGKVYQTLFNANDIKEMFIGKILSDIVGMKNKLTEKETANNGEYSKG